MSIFVDRASVSFCSGISIPVIASVDTMTNSNSISSWKFETPSWSGGGGGGRKIEFSLHRQNFPPYANALHAFLSFL